LMGLLATAPRSNFGIVTATIVVPFKYNKVPGGESLCNQPLQSKTLTIRVKAEGGNANSNNGQTCIFFLWPAWARRDSF
jgi:hypothetical protein